MRTPLALGAAVLLALGLGAGPAAATGDGDWTNLEDHSKYEGQYEGQEYTFSPEAKTVPDADKTCPEGDGWVKIDDVNARTYTVDVDDLPGNVGEGKLIAEYCVKAGSRNNGLGPVREPVDPAALSVEIAYPYDDKCRDISHISVRLVVDVTPTPDPTDDPSGEPTPTPSPDVSTEPSPVPSGDPLGDPSPKPSPSGEPGTDPTPEVSEGPEGRPQTVVPVEPGSDEPRASDVAVEVDDETAEEETVRAQTQAELPQTGPGRAIGIAVGALLLVGAGVGAVLFARSRRTGA